MLIQGSLVALVTPMTPEGAVDWDAYERLIEWHIASGTDGIVTMGTTGESPTLDIAEHNEVVAFTVKKVAGRVPVIAGTGGNSTAEAIELTQHARDVGADFSLQVVPYYNKPTQEGLYQHFKAIAEAVNMPMWLYNVPGRTVADLKNDTVLRLAQIPNIVGLKDATGDIARVIDLLRRLPEVVGDKEFAVYSGNDDSALALMLVGGTGVISVTANLMPREMHEIASACLQGDWEPSTTDSCLCTRSFSANPILWRRSGRFTAWDVLVRGFVCRSRRFRKPIDRWSKRRCAKPASSSES